MPSECHMRMRATNPKPLKSNISSVVSYHYWYSLSPSSDFTSLLTFSARRMMSSIQNGISGGVGQAWTRTFLLFEHVICIYLPEKGSLDT